MPPAKLHWTHLYDEVVTSGLCTGCAGCVISCPHDVLGYDHESGGYKPFHIEEELGPGDCVHGQKGCTTCTRGCRSAAGVRGSFRNPAGQCVRSTLAV